MIEFVQRCVLDETKSNEVLKAAIALLGDLVDCFRGRMSNILNQPFVGKMLQEGKQYEEMRQIANWTQKVCSTLKLYCRSFFDDLIHNYY